MAKKSHIKIIYFDLDGTLFNDHRCLSPASIAALDVLKANNIRFSVATGRHFLMIKRELETFQANNLPFITMNGSAIIFQNQIIYEKTIDFEITKKLMLILDDQKIGYYIYTNQAVYVSHLFPYHLKNVKVNQSLKSEWKYPFTLMEDRNKFLKTLSGQKIYKFLIIKSEDSQVDQLIQECLNNNYAYIRSQAITYDVFNKTANKGNALQYLADQNYFNLNECLVFGDNQNDVEMFQTAHYSVAMGNANAALKAIATEITDSNTNDGVANYVNHHWKHL